MFKVVLSDPLCVIIFRTYNWRVDDMQFFFGWIWNQITASCKRLLIICRLLRGSKHTHFVNCYVDEIYEQLCPVYPRWSRHYPGSGMSWLILGLRPANEGRRYFVTLGATLASALKLIMLPSCWRFLSSLTTPEVVIKTKSSASSADKNRPYNGISSSAYVTWTTGTPSVVIYCISQER